MSDSEDVGHAFAGTMIGAVTGVAAGVALRVFVVDESTWSVTEAVFCGLAVCGTLGLIFNRPLIWFVKEVLRLWGIYWFLDE